MDLSTLVGLVLAFGLVTAAILTGGSLMDFLDPSSFLIVVLGTFAVTLVNFPLPMVLGVFGVVKNAFFTKMQSPLDTVSTLVSLSERARREGILALEGSMDEIDDDFVRSGLRLAVDGVEPELIKDILQTELAFIEDRHRSGQSIFTYMGSASPALGMIGTLIGLVKMLGNLQDANAIGPAMAIALLTTLYGSLLANLAFIPLAGKLKVRSAEEILIKEVAIEGVMSIQSGDNPRILEQKLLAFLAPSIRPPREE
ncbi:MAG: MotA/TolQ/ExbB proton channel family protein [Candidatus Omnitrophica bacterium]|nr:MotA/TolQ/ExbB proton channel family protein [Candidatus Omnitrophota bacterium]